MPEITFKDIQNAQHGDTLATWTFIDEWDTNMNGTWRKVQWVAAAWVIDDFAIYFEYIYSDESEFYPALGEWSEDKIKETWDKLPSSMVKYVIQAEDKVLNCYRG